MGARVAAAIACETDLANFICGCVFLSYPLYCSSKPSLLRTDHLFPLPVPSLFISGESDEMCDKKTLGEVIPKMAIQPTVYWIAGANHGMTVKGRKKTDVEEEICKCVVDWIHKQLSSESCKIPAEQVSNESVKHSPIKKAFEKARKRESFRKESTDGKRKKHYP